MKSVTIARNYAEALFAAGDRFNEILDAVAGAIEADERIKTVLESPRVSKAAKSQILEKALKGEAPREFVRFLQAVIRRGRQGLLGLTIPEADGGSGMTRLEQVILYEEFGRALTSSPHLVSCVLGASLAPREPSRDQVDRIDSQDRHVLLVVRVERGR